MDFIKNYLQLKTTSSGEGLPKENNLDFLRLFFATSVMMVHFYRLSEVEGLGILELVLGADFAVYSFFVISGFLIFSSYERSKSLTSYFEKRFRRIYPAYFSVIIISSIVGFFISSLDHDQYLGGGLVKYILFNLSFANFVAPDLPGVFSGNPFVSAVNGALWTIKVEILFYISVPLICFFCRKIGIIYIFSIIYILSFFYHSALSIMGHATLAKQFPGQLTLFLSGGALFYFYAEFNRVKKYLLIPAFLICVFSDINIVLTFFAPLALSIIIISLAQSPYIGNFARYGDFSYGIYIWHFPIAQYLVSKGLFNQYPWGAVAVAAGLTVMMAFISWHLIERPFLKRANHYRQLATT